MADRRPLVLALLAACAPAEPPADDTDAAAVPADSGADADSGLLDADDDGSARFDCDDADPTIYPHAREVLSDGIDQDCDGLDLCRVDLDGDGAAGLSRGAPIGTCDRAPYVAADAPTDCRDDDPAAHPGAPELPGTGVDEDCDFVEICFVDHDRDGARTTATKTSVYDHGCATWDGDARAEAPIDCDDDDATRAPGKAERTADGVDQDCDGLETCFVDADGDGQRSDATITVFGPTCDSPGTALVTAPHDCDDTRADVVAVYEVPGDGIDEDCDGRELCYVDADGDGWRTDGLMQSVDPDCDDGVETLADLPAGDCDDFRWTRHPGATEIENDGLDQDCDGRDLCVYGAPTCPATSCREILEAGAVAPVPTWIAAAPAVYPTLCDLDRDGGGWTLAAVVIDDARSRWGLWGGWRPWALRFGDVADPDEDYRGRAIAEVGVHDVLFSHRPSGIWAAYHDVGDGTSSLVDLLAALPTASCDAPRFPLAAGTLTVGGDLCSTDLFLNPAGWDDGVCDPTTAAYGPAWSVGTGGGCPLSAPGALGSLGPDAASLAESDAVGFARALGLVDANGAGAMEIWVR